MRHFLVLFLCVFGSSVLFATSYPVFEAWKNEGQIRVGVKKPQEVISLYSAGTLLVVDGDRVVDTIKPGGDFLVIASEVTGGASERWLQIRAAKSKKVLERDRKRLSAKYSDLSFAIKRTRSGFYALRIGPLATVADSAKARKDMVREGFSDAFVLKARQGYPFQWVDSKYDKYPLKAERLGLVRTNPDLPITFEGTNYRGMLTFRVNDFGGIQVINQLPLETYLRGVVPSELGPRTFPHLEAQKAQAVAARTYALKNMGRFRAKGYDICDTPACQAYEGAKNEHPLSDQAVAETKGLVLYHGEKLIDALYTSTCGGTTEDVENVFPGRAEPYLRARSGYLMESPSYDLPEKPVDRERYSRVSEDLALRSLIWGFPEIPDFSGDLTGRDLNLALKHLAWVLGTNGSSKEKGPLTYHGFWSYLAQMDFFQAASENQVTDADLGVLLRHYEVPEDVQRFAGLAIRYDLVHRDQLRTFGNTSTMPRAFGYEVLLNLCEVLGPEMEWVRYRLEGLEGNQLKLSKGAKERVLNLNRYDYYLTDVADRLEFVEAPSLEEWDRIYTLKPPFTSRLLKVKESGVVASVDRFSAYDSWMDKKSVSQLEKRARRYIRGIRGIRDVRILERSESGRVTSLAFDADSGTHKVKGLRIRWSLGVRDNLFDILPGYRDGRLVHLVVFGRGWGHGVGMSQVGAFSLARQGWDFEKILTYYYTDVSVSPYKPR